MENFYLINYLKENDSLTPKQIDFLKYTLDQNIYYYGEQFKYPKESNDPKNLNWIYVYAKQLFILYKIFRNWKTNNNKTVFSNAYFTVNQELKKHGYNVYCPSWSITQDRNILSNIKLFVLSEKIIFKLRNANFNKLISSEFLYEINKFEKTLKSFFIEKKVKALILPHDMDFFEKTAIQVCKEINIPSFVFLHGLPGRYNCIDDNRADYLVVWGDKIKENYINAGVKPEKIFVSGHPYYKEFKNQKLNNSFENILVITKATPGAPVSDDLVLNDRGNSILYLYSIETILKSFGVKSVRFRLHPCENEKWYLKFINKDFFILDTDNLKVSIEKSSVVIGPTSTVFLESIFYGINYIVYEPAKNNIDLTNLKLVPPFDGSDSRIPVAKTEDELIYILKNLKKVDASVFPEYIKTPFDLSFIEKIV